MTGPLPVDPASTPPSAAPPPANWYPAPGEAGLLRWWDGRAWTEFTRPAPLGPITVTWHGPHEDFPGKGVDPVVLDGDGRAIPNPEHPFGEAVAVMRRRGGVGAAIATVGAELLVGAVAEAVEEKAGRGRRRRFLTFTWKKP